MLPDYFFDHTPEVQEIRRNAYEKNAIVNFFFLRLLDEKFMNWVVNLIDVEDPSQKDGPPKIGFIVFRVPKDVTNEDITNNMEDLKLVVANAVNQLILEASDRRINSNKK